MDNWEDYLGNWEDYYARKIAEIWDSLPRVDMRLRGKLGPDGRYYAQPIVEISLTVPDAEALCSGHVPDAELCGRIRAVVRKARKV